MRSSLRQLTEQILDQEKLLQQGGDAAGQERQKRLGRLTARERIEALIDPHSELLELGLWAGYEMYPEYGDLPAAGVITGIGKVKDRSCMIIANDATVKAGAFFPQSVKKVLRAQRIAYECRLPIIYLVDSSGVFLPLQDEIFPDEDDFGRIFRNNAVISATGVPQFAAIMGNCIAGGSYLPVLCDKLLMTEGSGLYLAGPALVKAAIGQVVDTEELGGAKMHASVSGTVDFYEKDDASCLKRLRTLVDLLPEEKTSKISSREVEKVYELISADCTQIYDVRDLINAIVDAESFQEYKALFGKALVCGYAKIDGISVGIVANQRQITKTGAGEIEIGGVIYHDSSDKAARFVMDCNQTGVPIIFLQDVMGFMVGKQSEQSGIIRSGAKLVNAVSNSIVPKITLLIGHSFGAGHYALGGKAYDPNFIFAWPNARYAVMGAEQAADTLIEAKVKAAEKKGKILDSAEIKKMHETLKESFNRQTDIRYGAARGWIDAIIAPHTTQKILAQALHLVKRAPRQPSRSFHTGVIQT